MLNLGGQVGLASILRTPVTHIVTPDIPIIHLSPPDPASMTGMDSTVCQNEGYLIGVLIMRTEVFWGLYWSPPKFGKP